MICMGQSKIESHTQRVVIKVMIRDHFQQILEFDFAEGQGLRHSFLLRIFQHPSDHG
jgi:hypothetical protein